MKRASSRDLFDKRARLSASVYQYRVKDKQLTAGSGVINMNQLINADKVTGQGAEIDFQAILSDSLRMTLGGSYNDTEIKDARLFVQQCGNFANTGGVAGCTVTNAAGPVPGHGADQRQSTAARAQVAGQLHPALQYPAGRRRVLSR